jgi:hypothetical protein
MKSTTSPTPLGAKKARQQHIAVGQVHLLVLGLIEARDLEEASFALIENRGEDAWRVELRKATPVDRTVHAHQRDRVQVADDAVGLDRLIGHFDTRLSKSGLNAVGIILGIRTENLNSKLLRLGAADEHKRDRLGCLFLRVFAESSG